MSVPGRLVRTLLMHDRLDWRRSEGAPQLHALSNAPAQRHLRQHPLPQHEAEAAHCQARRHQQGSSQGIGCVTEST